MKGKRSYWRLAWTRTWGERIAGERPYGQIYAKRLWRWEGGRPLAAARMCIGNFSWASDPWPEPSVGHARSIRLGPRIVHREV